MNYNETFLYAIKDKSGLPKGVTPSFFIGTLYSILEETEDKLLTILSGGTVEVQEEFILPMQPLDCRMLLYTKKRLWNTSSFKKDLFVRARHSPLSEL